MKLSEEDGELFMKLWSELTDYVSEQKNLENPLLWPPERVNTKEFHTAYTALLDALFSEDGVLIDSFVSANPDLPGDHQDLVLSWKNHITDKFILERYLKKGAVFHGRHKAFIVQGISESLEDQYWGQAPLMVETTLIPFRKVITFTRIISVYSISFGPGARRGFKESYSEMKAAKRVYSSLPVPDDDDDDEY